MANERSSKRFIKLTEQLLDLLRIPELTKDPDYEAVDDFVRFFSAQGSSEDTIEYLINSIVSTKGTRKSIEFINGVLLSVKILDKSFSVDNGNLTIKIEKISGVDSSKMLNKIKNLFSFLIYCHTMNISFKLYINKIDLTLDIEESFNCYPINSISGEFV